MSEARGKELVLAPGTYAYMQDTTKGAIKTFTGPTVINQTAQEIPVVYNPSSGTFETCDGLREAVRKSPIAVEGYYMVLFNPPIDNDQPETGLAGKPSPELDVGRRVNIPGPWMFPLWPGQNAVHIKGHHLRSNQYLLVRVYNEEEAKKNWSKAIVKPAVTDEEGTIESALPTDVPEDLTVGRMFVIKGTEVSFYIPPTGVTVVKVSTPEESLSNAAPEGFGYVRNALTLERLEYCILVAENGNKRYEMGPQVVFPQPTERFMQDANGQMKTRAIELNDIQGLHIKVIAPYTDENGVAHKEGDELFITGKETAIYFPREEHSLIRYDGRSKHFATAIPAGEARYVMDRLSGEIEMVQGPEMLLPDPRTKVIVRRVLSEKQCQLWYPDNAEVLAYNKSLRTVLQDSPTTRSGAISEGDYERSMTRGRKVRGRQAKALMTQAIHGDGGGGIVGDEFERKATYTQPRTITLDSKFQGAPVIDIWTGYAVMVVSKTGKGRVEQGRTSVQLDYDESLEVLELSTGKPKTTDKLFKTVYLRVNNNKVSDIIEAETADHVHVKMKLSYRVNFEGDPSEWFNVENYVKYFTDHCRSVLKAAIKKVKIGDFYGSSTDFIRDTILGVRTDDVKRPGMFFEENGMRVCDIEVLGVAIMDSRIQQILDNSQHLVVKTNIELENARHELDVSREKYAIEMQRTELRTVAAKHTQENQRSIKDAEAQTALAALEALITREQKQLEVVEAQEAVKDSKFKEEQDRKKAAAELDQTINAAIRSGKIEILDAETAATVRRFAASQEGFSEALLATSSNETMVKVAEALSVQNFIGGRTFTDVIQKVFADSPIAPALQRLSSRTAKNGDKRRKSTPPPA